MVRYADDLLILCKPGQGPGLQTRLKRWLEARKLKLNEEKTRLVDTLKEGIEFLGFSVAWRQGLKSKRWYNRGRHLVIDAATASSRTPLAANRSQTPTRFNSSEPEIPSARASRSVVSSEAFFSPRSISPTKLSAKLAFSASTCWLSPNTGFPGS